MKPLLIGIDPITILERITMLTSLKSHLEGDFNFFKKKFDRIRWKKLL